MSITHIAFDLDGVLFTSEDFIAQAYSSAIKASGLDLAPPPREKITAQFGNPGTVIMKELFGGLSEHDRNLLRGNLIKILDKDIAEGKGRLYDNIMNLLESLTRTYTLAVCSNGSEGYVSAILENKNIKQFFLPLLTLAGTGNNKKTELLKSYIDSTGTNGRNWILAGDRRSDLEAAKNNGCYFIGCKWGFSSEGELEGSDNIISEPLELLNAVKEINGFLNI